MLGQFTGQEETDSGLDLSAGDGGTLVVVGQTGSLVSDALENVVDKAVHDAHGLGGDTGVRVDLLHYFVDVDGVAFPPLPPPLLIPRTARGLSLGGCLLGSFRRGCFWWHT